MKSITNKDIKNNERLTKIVKELNSFDFDNTIADDFKENAIRELEDTGMYLGSITSDAHDKWGNHFSDEDSDL